MFFFERIRRSRSNMDYLLGNSGPLLTPGALTDGHTVAFIVEDVASFFLGSARLVARRGQNMPSIGPRNLASCQIG